MARAGWGVYYGDGSPRNTARKLKGAIQTSYRAEVRAVLHAVAGARENTMVVIDCKAVVRLLQSLLDGAHLPSNVADADLWGQIAQLVRGQENAYKVRWMPSHLDDHKIGPQKRAKYPDMVISDQDVKANAAADDLARNGANAHEVNIQWVYLEEEQIRITEAAQYMATRIWDKFLRDCNDAGNTEGEHEYADAIDGVNTGMEGNCVEEDPFDILQREADWQIECEQRNIDMGNGHERGEPASQSSASTRGRNTVPHGFSDVGSPSPGWPELGRQQLEQSLDHGENPCSQGTHNSQDFGDMCDRYPSYGWTNDAMEKTTKHCTTVAREWIEWPTILQMFNGKEIAVKDGRRQNARDKQHEKSTTWRAEPTAWEPVLWWFTECKWTGRACDTIENRGGLTYKQTNVSWMEMTIAFLAQTGYKLGGRQAPLTVQADLLRKMIRTIWSKARHHSTEQADLLRKMIRRIWSKARHHRNGRIVNAKDFWQPARYVGAAECITKRRMAGVQRRLILPVATWKAIAHVLEDATTKRGFDSGNDYTAPYIRGCKIRRDQSVKQLLDKTCNGAVESAGTTCNKRGDDRE